MISLNVLSRGRILLVGSVTCALIGLACAPMTQARAQPGDSAAPSQLEGIAAGIIITEDPSAPTSRSLLSSRAALLAGSAGVAVAYVDARSLPGATIYRLEEPVDASDLGPVISVLGLSRSVLAVEPDLLMKRHSNPPLPNDPEFSDQWHLWKNGAEGDFSVEAPEGWRYTSGRSDVIVAVLDTGFTRHPDLDARNINGYDFVSDRQIANDGDGRDSDASDPGDWISSSDQAGYFGDCGRSDSSWHGTHVAGIIAAERNNGRGGSGVAPDTRVLSVRVLGKCGGYTSDIVAAIRWSAGESVSGVPDNPNPAQVINMSLGGTGSCGASFRGAIRAAQERGVIVVAAAGNEGSPVSSASPANCPGVISVVATNPSGTRTSWSNYGTGSLPATIAAPGESILATLNSGRTSPGSPIYGRMSGTSMAAPVAAAGVALLISAGVKASEIPSALQKLTKPFPSRGSGEVCDRTECGAGLLDVSKLSEFLEPGPGPGPDPDPVPGPDPSPGPAPLTVPGIIDSVKVRYTFKGSVATAAVNWAHTQGAERSAYYLYRVKKGEGRWTKWTRRVAPAITIPGIPRAELSFLELRGVNELGSGLIYQVTLFPSR